MGHAGENLARRPISVSLVRPVVIIEAQPGANSTSSLGRRSIGLEEYLLIFQAPPQPLNEDVVQIPPLAIHADPHRPGLQSSQKIRAGELNALIGVENLRPPVLLHGLAQRRHAEIRIHRDRYPPR